ncbi:hypothetical protein [Neobacillus niacini]|uniref:hypothetical protein n=1 Tax=Neobacillus niacini TaxID=86668 RepID=UPI002FFE3577
MNEQLSNEAVKETATNSWAMIARHLGIGFMASIFSGIIFGLLLRLVMGIIAIFFPDLATGFSLGGTLMLVILGIAVTLANSIVYTLIFQKSRKGWIAKGLYFGFLSLFIYGTPLFLSNPNNELFGPQAPLGVSLFTVLFFLGALILVNFIESISKWVNHSSRRIKLAYVSFAVLVIPAVVMLVNIVAEIFYEMLPKIITNFTLFF